MTDNLPLEESQLAAAVTEPAPDAPVAEEKATSLWGDAWQIMRSRPMFWLSAGFIAFFITLAIAPQLFTNQDPSAPGFCKLELARETPNASALFGRDLIGCDVYTLTVYGARSSILVGVFATLATLLLGVPLGILAGYLGGWVDTVLSRLADMFFAIPLLLGGIIIMYSFKLDPGAPYLLVVAKVVLAIGVLGWPSLFRLMRSSVLQVKPNEYVQAARALGASPLRIIAQHVLPNAVAPVIVVATIDLGAYIAVEATLSYLGIGLQAPAISWGLAISDASGLGYIAAAPHMLLFPSLFLSLTVLAFIMLGGVVRDALDPKLR
ncbi:MAG: ABC transporter permease [Propionibacteriaceae bacterium]|nr:ABC transporter permease [Propionibacteriaceae bacterium]